MKMTPYSRISAGFLILFLIHLHTCWSNPAHHPSAITHDDNTSYSTNHSSHNISHDTHGHHGVEVIGIKYEEIKEPLVFTVVVLLAGLSKIGFHYADRLSSIVPESCLLIILGTVFGAFIHFSNITSNLPTFFTPSAFFDFLLPPIILEAAFSLYDRTFTDNIGSVLIFAVIGTIFACFLIASSLYGLLLAGAMETLDVTFIQILVFSSLIVAVDPVAVLAVFNEVGVNKVLYFLVFGESLLNDGVTVVLYGVLQAYNRLALAGIPITADQIILGIVKFIVVCLGGLTIGILVGVLSSFVTKYTNNVKVVEPIAIFAMAYLAFLLSELFHLSGIISIIGCGLTQVSYAFNNITPKSRTAIKYFSKVLRQVIWNFTIFLIFLFPSAAPQEIRKLESTTSEIIIFLFLGLSIVKPDHDWKTGFTLWTIFLCFLFRVVITFITSLLINRFDTYRVRKIKLDEMFIMSYGGLRGAVCFSLVVLLDVSEFPKKNMFITTTLAVVIFTVFIQGSTIKPLVNKLKVTLQDEQSLMMYQELNSHVTDHLMAGIEEVVGRQGRFYIREKLSYWNDKYLRKWLLKETIMKDEGDLLSCYEKLVMKEHYKNLHLCGAAKLPEINQQLRNIDSSAMLLQYAKEKGESELEGDDSERGPVQIKQVPTVSDLKHIMSRHNSFTKNYVRDRNLVGEANRGINIMQQLDNKRQSNARLLRMKTISKMRERALSWSDDNADVCIRRGTLGRNGPNVTKRAMTVDISPTSEEVISSISSTIPDTVFEEDEDQNNKEIQERQPLMDDDQRNMTDQEQRHAHFERQNAVVTDEIPLKPIIKRSKSDG